MQGPLAGGFETGLAVGPGQADDAQAGTKSLFGMGARAHDLLDHPGAKSIMVVGHEPDFSATIGALVGGGSIICRKGGLALVELPDAHSHKGELLWLVPPRILAT